MLLDQNALNELRALDPDGSSGLVAQVIESYMEDTNSIFAKLKSAIASSDATTMAREAHSLKSTSRSVGALRLGDLAADLEKIGRAGTIEGCAALLDAMMVEYKIVDPALREAGKPA